MSAPTRPETLAEAAKEAGCIHLGFHLGAKGMRPEELYAAAAAQPEALALALADQSRERWQTILEMREQIDSLAAENRRLLALAEQRSLASLAALCTLAAAAIADLEDLSPEEASAVEVLERES